MQNINHGKYINYLILWRNSEIDAASALKTWSAKREEREIGEEKNSVPKDLSRLYDVLKREMRM